MPTRNSGYNKFLPKREIGNNLRSLRYEVGIKTQASAADSLPISLDTYRKWEQGKSIRTIEDVFLLAECWGVDHLWLYCKLTGEHELAAIVGNLMSF